jgi:O-antigen/teichoic acid export membrane protein
VQQYRKLAGQTALYGMGTIVPRFLNYVVLTPFYTRIFTEAQYGMVTNLYAYIVFLLILLTYGLETGYFKFIKSEQEPARVFSTIMVSLFTTTLIFLSLIFLFQDPVARFLQYSGKPHLILLFSCVVAFDAVSAVPFAKLRFEEKAKKFGYLKIFNVGVNLFFNFFFYVMLPYVQQHFPSSPLLLLYDPMMDVAYVLISNLLATFFTFICLIPELRISLRFIAFRLLMRILRYSLPLLVVGLAGTINEVADKELIKRLVPQDEFPMEQLGIYGANYKLGMLMTIFIQMFRYAAEPFYFSKMRDYDAKNTYAQVMRYFIIFGLLIFLLVTLYIDLFKHFIDTKFYSGLHIVPVILLANLFLGINYNLSIWYKLNNLTKYGALIALIGAGITIALNILLIPVYGYVGSAWATLICYASMMIISYFLGRKFYVVPYTLQAILFYFVLALALFLIQNFIHYPSVVHRNIYNSLFLLCFIFIVFRKEHIKIKDIKRFINKRN